MTIRENMIRFLFPLRHDPAYRAQLRIALKREKHSRTFVLPVRNTDNDTYATA